MAGTTCGRRPSSAPPAPAAVASARGPTPSACAATAWRTPAPARWDSRGGQRGLAGARLSTSSTAFWTGRPACAATPPGGGAGRAGRRAAPGPAAVLLQESHEASNAFYRALGALSRDMTPAEVALVGRAASLGRARARTPPWHKRGGSPRGFRARRACAPFAPPTPPTTRAGMLAGAGLALWVGSTPEARRFLRRAAREAKAAGPVLASRVVGERRRRPSACAIAFELFSRVYKPEGQQGAGRAARALEGVWRPSAALPRIGAPAGEQPAPWNTATSTSRPRF